MTPLEAAIRAVCSHIGADPNTWQGFEEIGRVALAALIAALPPEISLGLKQALED